MLGKQLDASPGATSLIRQLLKAAANVAIEAKCDVLTAYSIVKAARESCDKVDASIQTVDDEADEDRAWAIFEKYVDDIRLLEK